MHVTVEDIYRDLRLAIQIANGLHRTLVIPPIPCPKSNQYCLVSAYGTQFSYNLLKGATFGFRESVRLDYCDEK